MESNQSTTRMMGVNFMIYQILTGSYLIVTAFIFTVFIRTAATITTTKTTAI